MNETSSLRIQVATLNSASRAASRLLALQDGYIVVLRAIVVAKEGNAELNESLESLQSNLATEDLDAEHYFLSILFMDLMSEIEIFFSQLLRAVISEFPKKVGSVSFKLSDIVDASGFEELIAKATDEYLNKLMYKKPLDYLESFCDLLSIDQSLIVDNWKAYIEAKARRDLGVHNQWVCNPTYLRKLDEAAVATSATVGDSMFPRYQEYVKPLLRTLNSMVHAISDQVREKYAQQHVAGDV